MIVNAKNTFCSYCGCAFINLAWPRQCTWCNNITYLNPKPVVVVTAEYDNGLLLIKRNHEPGKGKWALPGGYLEVDETWQEGCARELLEETGLKIDITNIGIWEVFTSPVESNLVIFGAAGQILNREAVESFKANSEVSELKIIYEPLSPDDMAFPSHHNVVKMFFDHRDI